MKLKEHKTQSRQILFWFFLIASFIFFAILLELKANGLKLNWHTWKLVKTGMITLDGRPNTAEVKINGKLYTKTLPVKIYNLAPGDYDISVSSQGSKTWHKTIGVEPGKASIFASIVLFRETAEEQSVPSNITLENVTADFQKQKENLSVLGPEIFWQDKLVTRFSENVLAAVVYPDNGHIVFQIGNEIRVIDIDGSNNQLLFELSSSEPTMISIKNNGKTIYYLDGGKIFAKNIN